jgi:hypothetical protein
MNVEIGAEAALFPEREYISGIFVAVHAIHSPFYLRILKKRIFSRLLIMQKNPQNKKTRVLS